MINYISSTGEVWFSYTRKTKLQLWFRNSCTIMYCDCHSYKIAKSFYISKSSSSPVNTLYVLWLLPQTKPGYLLHLSLLLTVRFTPTTKITKPCQILHNTKTKLVDISNTAYATSTNKWNRIYSYPRLNNTLDTSMKYLCTWSNLQKTLPNGFWKRLTVVIHILTRNCYHLTYSSIHWKLAQQHFKQQLKKASRHLGVDYQKLKACIPNYLFVE